MLSVFEEILQNIKQVLDELKIETSLDIIVPKKKIDQVIGQQKARNIVKYAIENRRHVLLIGDPGTGKSLLASSMAEEINAPRFQILGKTNLESPDNPIIFRDYELYDLIKLRNQYTRKSYSTMLFDFISENLVFLSFLNRLRWVYEEKINFADFLSSMFNIFILSKTYQFLFQQSKKRIVIFANEHIKRILESHVIWKPDENFNGFVAVNSASNAYIFGDIKHDPLKGLEIHNEGSDKIPKFLVPGAVHKAHKGVLYVDEIGLLNLDAQYELLTILQEKKAPIKASTYKGAVGTSNAYVQTNDLECDFCLVLAGNLETVDKLHPALRSRILSYGYEVLMQTKIPISKKSIIQMLQFFGQEIKKHKLKPFSRSALEKLFIFAIRDSETNNHFTLKLRDFSGYMLSANDICKNKIITDLDVDLATEYKIKLQKQILREQEKAILEYLPKKSESEVGLINLLSVTQLAKESTGLVMRGKAISTRQQITAPFYTDEIVSTTSSNDVWLNDALKNVNLLLPRQRIKYKIKFEMLLSIPVAGDSLGLGVFISSLSCIYNLKLKQNFVITGALNTDGTVKAVGGLREKIDAALLEKYELAIVPEANIRDVVTPDVKIKAVSHFREIIDLVFDEDLSKLELLKSDLDNKQGYSISTI